MRGPLLLVLGGAVVGALLGGWPGLVGGALIGAGLIGAVVASMAAWAHQIGRHLPPGEAQTAAPRPWGFGSLADRVYRELGPAGGAENAENA